MRRRTAGLVAVLTAAAAAGASGFATHATAGGSGAVRSWSTALGAAGVTAAAAPEQPAISGAPTLRFSSRSVRFGNVDTGATGDSPGDYTVFEEILTNAGGDRIGRSSARCMLIVRSVRCDATFDITGRGTYEVSQSFFANGDPTLAVTGGTRDFRNVRGQARIVGGSGATTDWVVDLLP